MGFNVVSAGKTTFKNSALGGNVKNSAMKNAAIESGGFLVAEGVSMASSLGVVALADLVIPKPIMTYGAQVLGKAVVEPFLDTIDSVTSKLCKLEECKVDKDKSREERAEQIGKGIIVFSAAYVISMGAKIFTRRVWNDHIGHIDNLGLKDVHPQKLAPGTPLWEKIKHGVTLQWVSPHEKMIFTADEGLHYGSLYLLNNQMAPFTDRMIRKTADVIHKTTGADEEKSHEIASMFSIWELPNILGAAAGIAAITGAHTKGWPTGWVEKVLSNKQRPNATQVEKLEKTLLSGISHTL